MTGRKLTRDLAALACLCWAAGYLTHRTAPWLAAAVACVVLAGVVLAVDHRARAKARQLDLAVGSIVRLLGRGVKVGRPLEWSGWRRPQLCRLVLSYPADAPSTSPMVRGEVRSALTARMGGPLDLRWDETRALVMARRLPPPAADDKAGAALLRVREVVDLLLPDADVDGVQTGPAGDLVAFKVRYRAHASPAVAEFRSRCDEVLRQLTGSGWVSWWEPAADLVTYRRRPDLPAHVVHPVDVLAGEAALPFATGPDGKPVAWSLSSASHMVVIGRTGSGKTCCLLSVVVEAARRRVTVAVCDVKRVSYSGVRGWPGVEAVATSLGDIDDLIGRVWNEMERRYSRLESRQADEADLDPVLLVVDEVAELVERLRDAWKQAGKKGEHPAVDRLRSIARLGRQARCHLLLGMQRPDTVFLSGETRTQLAYRVILGDSTATMRNMLEVDSNVTASTKGRAIVADGDREKECQVWLTPDPGARQLEADDRALLAALRPDEPAPPVLYPEPAEEPTEPPSSPAEPDPEPEPARPRLRIVANVDEHQEVDNQPAPAPLSTPDVDQLDPAEPTLTAVEVAERLSVSRARVSALVKAGRLTAHPAPHVPGLRGGRQLFRLADVERIEAELSAWSWRGKR